MAASRVGPFAVLTAGERAQFEAFLEEYRRRAGESLDGLMTLRWIYLQCLREIAHHAGHADIPREQTLAAGTRGRAHRAG